MSKPVTASLALVLAEKGAVELDDDVAKYLPCFAQDKMRVLLPGCDSSNPATEPLKAPLTLRHLLSHTSGLTYAIFGDNFADQKLREQFTPAELANWMSDVPNPRMCEAAAAPPLLFQPGTHFHYGLSSDVVGHVLEVATGTPLDTLMQREICGPLGMVDTNFYCPPEKAHRLAACYGAQPGFRAALLPPGRCAVDKLEKPAGLHGGGGLVSTARDYAKFCRFLQTGEARPGGRVLLSPASIAEMRRNVLPGDIATAAYDKGAVRLNYYL
jgi:CubicO group peptidase (beta-lactamase class C family)